MATEETREITVEIRADVAERLEKRAESMALFLDEYCALVVANWHQSGETLSIKEP